MTIAEEVAAEPLRWLAQAMLDDGLQHPALPGFMEDDSVCWIDLVTMLNHFAARHTSADLRDLGAGAWQHHPLRQQQALAVFAATPAEFYVNVWGSHGIIAALLPLGIQVQTTSASELRITAIAPSPCDALDQILIGMIDATSIALGIRAEVTVPSNCPALEVQLRLAPTPLRTRMLRPIRRLFANRFQLAREYQALTRRHAQLISRRGPWAAQGKARARVELSDEALIHMPIALLILDAHGLVRYANNRAISLFERDPVGDPIDSLLPPAMGGPSEHQLPFSHRLVAQALAVNKERRIVPVEVTLVGHADGTHCYLRDLRERQSLEKDKRLLARQLRLTHKTANLGEMSRWISHDFNNLLATVESQISLAHESIDDPETEDRLLDILELIDSGRALTAALLTYTRSDTEDIQALDVGRKIQSTATLLRRAVPDDVQLNINVGAGVMVKANDVWLEQIITNLVINARDAMPAGGVITIDVESEQDVVRISVTDTGSGMSEELLEQVFEPNFTTKPDGSGIGLALVRDLMERQRGTIAVHSRPGEGSRFEMTLPRAAPP